MNSQFVTPGNPAPPDRDCAAALCGACQGRNAGGSTAIVLFGVWPKSKGERKRHLYGENIPGKWGQVAGDEFDPGPGNGHNFRAEGADTRVFTAGYRGVATSEALAFGRGQPIAGANHSFDGGGADNPTPSQSAPPGANGLPPVPPPGQAQFSPIPETAGAGGPGGAITGKWQQPNWASGPPRRAKFKTPRSPILVL